MTNTPTPTQGRARNPNAARMRRPLPAVGHLRRRAPVRASVVTAIVAAFALSLTPAAQAAGDWPWPVEGEVLTSYRNGDDPYAAGQHRGIDIAGTVGTAVRSATAGTVRYAGSLGTSGRTVSIRTADGQFDTSYLHLSEIDVTRRRRVRR